jgi:LysM repeat protein
MNKKIRNAKHLVHPFHYWYLSLIPILILISIIIWLVSLQKARQDLTVIGRNTKGVLPTDARSGLEYHRIRSYDTFQTLAEEHKVSVESILWANNMTLDTPLIEDSVIIIPPVTGIIHTVENRETIESIAEKYHVTPDKITGYPYNTFTDDPAFPITPGQILYIPDGTK